MPTRYPGTAGAPAGPGSAGALAGIVFRADESACAPGKHTPRSRPVKAAP